MDDVKWQNRWKSVFQHAASHSYLIVTWKFYVKYFIDLLIVPCLLCFKQMYTMLL